jgi:hypothetical protein
MVLAQKKFAMETPAEVIRAKYTVDQVLLSDG